MFASCMLFGGEIAQASTRTWTSGAYAYIAELTTSNANDIVKEVANTRSRHYKGETGPTLTVQQSKTLTTSVNVSVTASFEAPFVTMSSAVGLTESESHMVGTMVAYTIPSSRASGIYRIKVVFPGKRITFKGTKVIKKTGERTVEVDKSYNFMPKKNEAYNDYDRVTS